MWLQPYFIIGISVGTYDNCFIKQFICRSCFSSRTADQGFREFYTFVIFMKTVFVDQTLGSVSIQTRRNAKGICLRVSPDLVSITAHPLLLHRAWPLTDEQMIWVLAAQQRLKTKLPQKNFFTSDLKLQTATFTMQFEEVEQSRSKFQASLEKGVLLIRFYSGIDFHATQTQEAIKRILTHFLRQEAQHFLPLRVSQLAKEYAFNYSNVRISSAKSHWGSCNSKQTINLSYYLMMLSPELIELVILHELCHTEQMNHGEIFYNRLRTAIGDRYNTLERQLRQQGKYVRSWI